MKPKHPALKKITTSFLSGLLVVLPVIIVIAAFSWIYSIISAFLRPITGMFAKTFGISWEGIRAGELLANIVTFLIIIILVFLIGSFVKTRFGKKIHNLLLRFFNKIPGYNVIHETVNQFVGDEKNSPFSQVVLVQLFSNSTLVTGFVTDMNTPPDSNSSDIQRISVFIPSVPNPTGGFVYHLEPRHVHFIDVPIEDALKSIVSFGGGSNKLIEAYRKKIEGKDRE